MYKALEQFIRGLYEMPEGFIPMHEPKFVGREKEYVNQCIESTFVSSVGEFVDRFSNDINKYTNSKFSIPVSNGTAALHLALVGANVQQDDEVLTQPLTFIATCNAIKYQLATPHFIDVDKDTLGMSPTSLKQRLDEIAEMRDGACYNKNTGRKIKACVPMHTFGLPCRIEEIAEICKAYNIVLIEDAAESIGSSYNGMHTGTFGQMGTISFNGNKIITSGGGGVIITDDEELGLRLKHLSTQAKIPHPFNYEHDEVGYNYRMPNINAALACAQLEKLDEFIEDKRQIHQRYQEFFAEYSEVELIEEISGAKSNYWLNALILQNESDQNEFLETMNGKGIMCRPIWKLMNRLPMFQNCPSSDLTNALWAEKRVVNITSSSRLK